MDAIKIINPFTDIPSVVREDAPPRLENLTSMSVGVGARAFRVDKNGMWMGAEKWSDANVRIDMDGNAYIAGVFSMTLNDLDDVGDGTTYKRVLATSISAGLILMSAVSGDLDDVDNGATYSKVLTTAISAGNIKLDETVNGTYAKVLSTAISAGKIILTGAAGTSGSLPNANVAGLGGLALKSAVAAADCDTTIISGGKIITGLLTASNIQTGSLYAIDISSSTITSSVFRTSDTGENVYITASQVQSRSGTTVTAYMRGGAYGGCLVLGSGGAEYLGLYSYITGIGPAIYTGGGLTIDLNGGYLQINNGVEMLSWLQVTSYVSAAYGAFGYATIDNTGGAGFFSVRQQSANPSAAGSNYIRMYFDGSGNICFKNSSNQKAYIDLNTSSGSVHAYA